MKKMLMGLLAYSAMSASLHAQDLVGPATGNYTGIAGMTLNPASIVDSRLKFDVNLIGLSNYFTNNYFSVKRDAFINGDFFKSRYRDWSAVRRDLLETNRLRTNEKVYARMNTRVQIPLSFMLTTGPRSAIALNMNNRTGVMIDNVDQRFAQLAYNRFEDASLYNQPFNMNGVNADVLNWLDIGFTYGRVLLNSGKHFIKAAFTAKYIGGVASGYFGADRLNVSFSDKDQVNAQTPYMRYGHSEKLSLDMFRSASLRSLRPEAEGFGWDAGIVYEYRGTPEKFRYLTPEYEEKNRRDYNKYAFRLGVSVLDAGWLRFRKGGLNNDFSADIAGWNLNNYRVRSVQDIDTLLARQVSYPTTADGNYTVALPTMLAYQLDLHLWKGFYLNAMTYQPFEMKSTNRKITNVASYAITPRFESRVFGLYMPVSYNELDDWNVGATVRLGPLYAGSSNLGSMVFNKKVKTAEFHVGLRVPIAFGSPSKILRLVDRMGTTRAAATTKRIQADTLRDSSLAIRASMEKEVQLLQQRLAALERQRLIDSVVMSQQSQQFRQAPVNITINNYAHGQVPVVTVDSIRYRPDSGLDTTKRSDRRVDTLVEPQRIAAPVLLRDSVIIREFKTDTLQRTPADQFYRANPVIPRVDTITHHIDTNRLTLQQKDRQIDTLLYRLAEKEIAVKEMNERMRTIEAESAVNTTADSVAAVEKPKKWLGIFPRRERKSAPAVTAKPDTVTTTSAQTTPIANNYYTTSAGRDNADLQNEIARLREEIRAYGERTIAPTVQTQTVPSYPVNDRVIYVEQPQRRGYDAPPVVVNPPAVNLAPATSAPTSPVIVRDTIYRADTVWRDRESVRAVRDTVFITKPATVQETVTPASANTTSVPENLLHLQLERILFAVNQTSIQPIYFSTLQFIAENLRNNPGLKLKIDGYTDKSGNPAVNERLSRQRADAVKNYLQKAGVSPGQLLTAYHGAKEPLTLEDTRSAQLLNRRVELRFTK